MKKGFVFGKFLPLHNGHIELICFAQKNCDHLTIIVCASNEEKIGGSIRKAWVEETAGNCGNTNVILFNYDESQLPNTSVASREISFVWANAFSQLVPDVDIVFTSEPYGVYVAEYMHIEHLMFDNERSICNISASQIRNDPFRYWDFLPAAVKPFFVKKIVILGTESTGKSVMAEKLAEHFSTVFVPEMARQIIEHTESCEYEHLVMIAELHAAEIRKRIRNANKLLFIDTDVNITCSYSRFLFNRELEVDATVSKTSNADLYIFLSPDCDYVQDGTRLSKEERNKLSDVHEGFLKEKGIDYTTISGKTWEERVRAAIHLVKDKFF